MNKYFIHFESKNPFVNSVVVVANSNNEAIDIAKESRGDSFISVIKIIDKGVLKPSVIRIIDNL